MLDKPFKYDEIKDHFYYWLEDQDPEWIAESNDDIHHHCFNTDYYIIGTYQAKQWLGDEVFHVIETIKEYEKFNFGEVTTDFSDPEKIVNMYAYIIGEQVVYEWQLKKEAINF
tara:strand:+ start:586 stop:924 length:339 start_codon:yes stop_codon:yes gene_type:complete